MEARALSRRVAFIGEYCIGKTRLAHCMSEGITAASPYRPTLAYGSVTAEARVGAQTVSITIIDTAGQERFRSLVPKYFRGADLIAVCFDPGQEQPWVDGAREYARMAREGVPGTPIVAIATRHDRWAGTVDLDEIERVVSEELEIPRMFVTSAWTGFQIDDARDALAQIALTATARAAHGRLAELKSGGCC
jgi:GTPase SAR1 family protein